MSAEFSLTSVHFTALVFVMAALTTIALCLPNVVGRSRITRAGAVLVFALAYLVVPALLAISGALDRYAPVPRPMLLVVALTTLTSITALSPIGSRLASSLPLSILVGFQAFRVPVELVLHRLALEGVIPFVMTYAGWNFDILSGSTAAILGVLVARRRVPRGLLAAWNVAGLLLLANIVTIAVLAAPVPFQLLRDGPSNTLPSTFPYVWLPCLLVQLALFGHLLTFRRLGLVAAG